MVGTPRILVINPNTSPRLTAAIDDLSRSVLGERAIIETRTASFGFRYIASRVAVSVAAHAVLDTAARAIVEGQRPDVIVLGCFGDPGREALAEMLGLPVVGFAEAGLLAAAALPGRYLVATRGQVWCDLLAELVLVLGLQDHVAGIISIEVEDDDPAAIAAMLDRSAAEHDAGRVVLGGAGLIPIMDSVSALCRTPILDPHQEALLKALQQAALSNVAVPIDAFGEAQLSGLSDPLRLLLTQPRTLATA